MSDRVSATSSTDERERGVAILEFSAMVYIDLKHDRPLAAATPHDSFPERIEANGWTTHRDDPQ